MEGWCWGWIRGVVLRVVKRGRVELSGRNHLTSNTASSSLSRFLTLLTPHLTSYPSSPPFSTPPLLTSSHVSQFVPHLLPHLTSLTSSTHLTSIITSPPLHPRLLVSPLSSPPHLTSIITSSPHLTSSSSLKLLFWASIYEIQE